MCLILGPEVKVVVVSEGKEELVKVKDVEAGARLSCGDGTTVTVSYIRDPETLPGIKLHRCAIELSERLVTDPKQCIISGTDAQAASTLPHKKVDTCIFVIMVEPKKQILANGWQVAPMFMSPDADIMEFAKLGCKSAE
jgi:hypothetical protein